VLQELASIQGVHDFSEALLLYSTRHYDRMDRVLQSTFTMDYLLGRLQAYTAVPNDSDMAS
jgi:hypothetical protein